MRVLGFSKKWRKLEKDEYSTFRWPRKDADRGREWQAGETVQIVYRMRTPQREVLGIAQIVTVTRKSVAQITEVEAIADGFTTRSEMLDYLDAVSASSIINKLSLKWVERATERTVTNIVQEARV